MRSVEGTWRSHHTLSHIISEEFVYHRQPWAMKRLHGEHGTSCSQHKETIHVDEKWGEGARMTAGEVSLPSLQKLLQPHLSNTVATGKREP